MNYIVIPARKGSKGFPEKNRLLFPHTVEMLKECDLGEYKIIVTTDDEDIMGMASECGYIVIQRSQALSDDRSSIKYVLIHVVGEIDTIERDDTIIMLYLTYPDRTWDDVRKAVKMYESSQPSLLCAVPVRENPYLMIDIKKEYGSKCYGDQVVAHDLYRRQDYPEFMKISHYVFVCRVGNLFNLNNNLYTKDTVYMKIDSEIDVDTQEDYERFKKSISDPS